MSDTAIGDECAKALSEMLKVNTTWTTLNMEGAEEKRKYR